MGDGLGHPLVLGYKLNLLLSVKFCVVSLWGDCLCP